MTLKKIGTLHFVKLLFRVGFEWILLFYLFGLCCRLLYPILQLDYLQPHLPQQKKKLLWLGKAQSSISWLNPAGGKNHPSKEDATVDASISHQDS